MRFEVLVVIATHSTLNQVQRRLGSGHASLGKCDVVVGHLWVWLVDCWRSIVGEDLMVEG
jgi:hypothetical protein